MDRPLLQMGKLLYWEPGRCDKTLDSSWMSTHFQGFQLTCKKTFATRFLENE